MFVETRDLELKSSRGVDENANNIDREAVESKGSQKKMLAEVIPYRNDDILTSSETFCNEMIFLDLSINQS